MTTFILRRLIQTAVVIILLSYFCYTLMTLMPGDPVELMIQSNPRITTADVQRLRNLYGLDQPNYVRYWNWAKTILAGDLGYSRTYRVPVSDLIGPRLVNTFILSFTALVFSLLIAIPLGMITALRAGTKWDYLINFFAFGGISVPSFWLGIVLIIFFGIFLGWLPAGGTATPGIEASGFFMQIIDRLKYLILPALALSYLEIGIFMRFTRSAMLETLRSDYIRTAKAKGLSRPVIIWLHAFRNALIPLITIVTLSLATVFSGATITETVFAYQGVGKLVYDSIISNDFNVAMVSFMISVSMVLIFNLVADILYGVADPRISYE
jgi:peptide/nickel transport system permease protein